MAFGLLPPLVGLRWTNHGNQPILQYMVQLLVEIDDETAERLERVAPSRSRKRSAFVRSAIRQALDQIAEQEMAEAYRAHPDRGDEVLLDPSTWEPRKQRVRR